MKPALAPRQVQYPCSWQALPNGELILAEINQQLKPWWPKFFGYYLLSVGTLSREVQSEHCVIRNHVNILPPSCPTDKLNTPLQHPNISTVESDLDNLPLIKRSVDVCILSHVLEFSSDPHHVVREANRVLMPNGYLVITGFNPFSLAGLNKFLPYRKDKMPWKERFFSSMRIKDWLHLMGYEIMQDNHVLHSTLEGKVQQGPVVKKLRTFAEHVIPSLGSVYVIVAKKRELPLTPIKPKWHIRTSFKTGKVAPVSSTQSKTK